MLQHVYRAVIATVAFVLVGETCFPRALVYYTYGELGCDIVYFSAKLSFALKMHALCIFISFIYLPLLSFSFCRLSWFCVLHLLGFIGFFVYPFLLCNALRVLPAETRLTVYRRLRVDQKCFPENHSLNSSFL